MTDSRSASETLQRRIGLRSAVLFNMLEMIGVGPFITLPLVIAAAGYRLSVVGVGAGRGHRRGRRPGLGGAGRGISARRRFVCVSARDLRPDGAGNWLSFLYVWQLSFSAPLSIASGCIGLSSFLAWFWPGLDHAPIAALPVLHYSNFAAAAACLLVTALLYRNLSSVTRLAWVLFAGVMAAHRRRHRLRLCACRGHRRLAHARLARAVHRACRRRSGAGHAHHHLRLLGLLQHHASWAARCASRSGPFPRAILLSVLFVSAFYVAMNLAALPSLRDAASHASRIAAALSACSSSPISHSPHSAAWAGRLMAALIVWTAFASVFSLLLGYSRVPYAAARDGNYFRFLAAVHPKPRHPAPLAGCAGTGGLRASASSRCSRSSLCWSSRASCCSFSCSRSA